MYPIPAHKNLKIHELADHWSRDIQPKRSKEELINDLAMSWLRGEFQSSNNITRLNMLKVLFKTQREKLIFWISGEERPQTEWDLPDGGVEILLNPVLPIPSTNPDMWTDDECKNAFEVIAKEWCNEWNNKVFEIIKLAIYAVTLSESEFTKWTQKMGYTRPDFWAPQTMTSVKNAKSSDANLPKKRPGSHKKVVEDYIKYAGTTGNSPSKSKLEDYAKSLDIKGGRDQRRIEFDRQMGEKAPKRGRQQNKSPK